VTVEVVEVLEAVEVEVGESHAGARVGEGLGQQGVEGAAIERPRERVTVRLVAQALLPGTLRAHVAQDDRPAESPAAAVEQRLDRRGPPIQRAGEQHPGAVAGAIQRRRQVG